MTTDKTHFAIPTETAQRIIAIAEARGHDSVHDLLADFVQREIERGTIPKGIPGVSVSGDGGTVCISAKTFTAAVSRQVAAVMAERLKAIREAQQVAEIELAEGVMMKVRRHGKGARIEIPAQGQAFSTSLATAEELGSLIADAAK